ncbi:CARDB domain-containing protein [Planctomicrobium sp. SH664]|uniref:CARDB domain-containing protein n=1 Tax=Planctomicrobium sp. SH664 TaxID=3448125 RepID=UPI003F5C739B
MQNLLLKLVVLSGVIGGSGFVVWRAHDGLQQPSAQITPESFNPLESDASAAPTANVSDLTDDPFAQQLGTLPTQRAEIPATASAPESAPFDFENRAFPRQTASAPAEPAAKPGTVREFPMLFGGTEPAPAQEAAPELPPAASPPPIAGIDARDPFQSAPEPAAAPPQTEMAAPPQEPELKILPVAAEVEVPQKELKETPQPLPLPAQTELLLPQSEPEVEPLKPQAEPEMLATAPLQTAELPEQEDPHAPEPTLAAPFGPSHQKKMLATDDPFAVEPVEPKPLPGADHPPGLTKLPPTHPGPVLLPAGEMSPQAAPRLPSGVVTADGAVAEENDLILPAAGDAPPQRPFLPLAPATASAPAPIQAAEEILPEIKPAVTPAKQAAPFEMTITPQPVPDKPFVPMAPTQAAPTQPAPALGGGDPFAETPAPVAKPKAAPMMPILNPAPAASDEILPTPASGAAPAATPAPSSVPWDLQQPAATPRQAPAELPLTPLNPQPAPAPTLADDPFGVSPPATIRQEAQPNLSSQPQLEMPGNQERIPPAGMLLPSGGSELLPTPATPAAPRPAPVENLAIPLPTMPQQSTIEPVTSLQMQKGSVAPGELLGHGEPHSNVPTGPQTPELKIEKIAPSEATIGEPVVYAIVIRNAGGSTARDVKVEDQIPKGARLEGTIPQAVLSNGKLLWELGSIEPGAERKIQLKVTPLEPGQIGSVATVSFAAAVTASIRVTAPKLTIDMTSPSEGLVGEKLAFHFTLKNSGEGAAKNVFLRAILPQGLKHPGGNDIEYEVGTLAPGASRTIDLTVLADQPGIVTPRGLVTNDGKTQDETRSDLRVIEARLKLERTGPARRFVNRPATFVTTVTNESQTVLKQVVVKETVPQSVQLAGIPAEGRWDAVRHTISWEIPQLQPGESRRFESKLAAVTAGDHQGTVIAQDAAGNRAEVATSLEVKGFADLAVDMASPQRTVVVGEQLSVRVTLKNDGTAGARQVKTTFEIPPGLQFAAAKGPVSYDLQGNLVTFSPLNELPVRGEQVYDLVLTAIGAGSTKVTLQLESADFETLRRDHAVRVIAE